MSKIPVLEFFLQCIQLLRFFIVLNNARKYYNLVSFVHELFNNTSEHQCHLPSVERNPLAGSTCAHGLTIGELF